MATKQIHTQSLSVSLDARVSLPVRSPGSLSQLLLPGDLKVFSTTYSRNKWIHSSSSSAHLVASSCGTWIEFNQSSDRTSHLFYSQISHTLWTLPRSWTGSQQSQRTPASRLANGHLLSLIFQVQAVICRWETIRQKLLRVWVSTMESFNRLRQSLCESHKTTICTEFGPDSGKA